MVEAAPNAMVLVDHEGRITLVNAQAEKLFGYARTELLGRSIELLVPNRFRRGHDGLRDSFSAQAVAICSRGARTAPKCPSKSDSIPSAPVTRR